MNNSPENNKAASLVRRVLRRLRRGDSEEPQHRWLDETERRLSALEREVQELRQLNRRLADALDVMTELLVPAMDRDDEKVREALRRLG